MKLKSHYFYIFIMFLMLSTTSCFDFGIESDTSTGFQKYAFFDLRDRESFVQITETFGNATTFHIQIFDVGNNCNENNFFDNFTGNDTHVYNLRNILTNDGNPSGVVLPEGAYGLVVITLTGESTAFVGNSRILDSTGYEYRTNIVGATLFGADDSEEGLATTINFNKEGGVGWSDVIGFTVSQGEGEAQATNIVDINILADIDIYNLDEVPFSCRNVIFACTDQDNPLYESLLAEVGSASVASFEYGINDAIPHSRGGEVLCPGNNIDEGFVRIRLLPDENELGIFGVYVGLNNGNGRGSMDSYWKFNPLAGGLTMTRSIN